MTFSDPSMQTYVAVPTAVPALTTRCGNVQDDQQTSQLVAFRKAMKPHSAEEAERWEQDEISNTITGYDERHSLPPHLVAYPTYSVGLGSDVVWAEELAQPVTGRNGDPGNVTQVVKAFISARAIRNSYTANGFGVREDDVSDTLMGDGGGAVLIEPHTFDWQQGSSGDTSFRGKARSYIVDPPSHARSLTANRTLAVHTEMGVRRLTPLECERLQGFPDGWTDDHPDSVRYRQIGNAIAVPVFEWLARRMYAWMCAHR